MKKDLAQNSVSTTDKEQTMTPHKKVVKFNQDILEIAERKIGLQALDEFNLSLHQLREEIDEMEEKYHQGDLVGVLDGLIDLDYFQKGVVYKMGITEQLYNRLFGIVHDANMAKAMGKKATRLGYGNAADAVKPDGWIPPEETMYEVIMEELKCQN